MKKIFSFIILSFFEAVVLLQQHAAAQPPQKMGYQAVIRDNYNHIVANHPIGIKVTIIKDYIGGPEIYTETQTPYSDANGLISIEIGGAEGFSSINWGGGHYLLKTEIDPEGGSSYKIEGTTGILSVPYALYSKYAENAVDLVKLTGDQTIAGNKTFTGKTSVPNPMSVSEISTKAYVDSLLVRIEYLELLSYGITDARDGNHYKVVKIGSQLWMAENLKYLPAVQNNADFMTQGYNSQPAYCVYGYDGSDVAVAKSQANYTTYGVLYNWFAANSANLCLTGWHLPSDGEWTTLTDNLGGTALAGGQLKETGTAHWASPNPGATNQTGFTALPGGDRYYPGSDFNMGLAGYWWSKTEYFEGSPWIRSMDMSTTNCYRNLGFGSTGYSVRCIKD
jgi:uncharacterized protein (TIGR02145 family)